ncbi:hypothetical protein TWF694_011314 [Orbilia ellipsospora]|uniref:Rhodopsin domain-containing protein n=1 Tax=Orbilia ellipsospora TaxID=2528407 RepID=A0AAV9X4Y7_9PEZI
MSLTDIDPNAVVIKSTGQTAGDLLGLKALWDILQVNNNPYLSQGWQPPALADPNYVPERQEEMKTGLAVAFPLGMLFTGLLVAAKITTTQRGRPNRLLFLEDWLLILALLSSYAVFIVSCVSVFKYQAGWHIYDVHIGSAEGTFRLAMIINVLSIWTYTITRISLLLSIRRLYSSFKTKMQLICDVLIFCKCLYCLGSFAALVFQVPDHPGVLFDIWKSTTYKARPMLPTIGICAAGVFLDILILLTPLPLVSKLKKLPTGRKIQIFIIFLCGFMTILASICRLTQIIRYRNAIISDQTYYIPVLELVNYFEIILAITTGCLPSAKVFFRWAYNRRHFPTLQGRELRTDSSRQGFVMEGSSPETWNSRSDWQSLYTLNTGDMNKDFALPIQHDIPRPVSAKINGVGLLDDHEDDDDNFYDHLQPSDAFFPSATTGLSPRPRR